MRLTDRQLTALRCIADEEARYGEGAAESTLFEAGLERPRRSCGCLVAKGLAVEDGWLGPEDGSIYKLTDAARELLPSQPTGGKER